MRALRRAHPGWFELAVFALAYLIYFGVRAITEGRPADAVAQRAGADAPRARAGPRLGRRVQRAVVDAHGLMSRQRDLHVRALAVLILAGCCCSDRRASTSGSQRCLLTGGDRPRVFALFPVAPPGSPHRSWTRSRASEAYRSSCRRHWSTSTRRCRASTPAGTCSGSLFRVDASAPPRVLGADAGRDGVRRWPRRTTSCRRAGRRADRARRCCARSTPSRPRAQPWRETRTT